MSYVNAKTILPEELLDELRKYLPEGMLYIPRDTRARRRWGERTGSRKEIASRNEAIRRHFRARASIEELAELFCLSTETIKKIVYSK